MGRYKKTAVNLARFILFAGVACAFLLLNGSIVFKTASISNADLLVLTRNAFALLLAFATVCFSWSRTLIEEHREQALKITRLGEASFFIAILFLVAAILKYYQVQSSNGNNLYTAFLMGIVNVVFPVIFFSAACATLYILYQIIRIWFRRFFG